MRIPGERLSKLKLLCSGLVAAAQGTWARETRVGWGAARERGGEEGSFAGWQREEIGILFQFRALDQEASIQRAPICLQSEENPTSPRLGRKKHCSFFAQYFPLVHSLAYLSGMYLKGREQPTGGQAP